MRDARAQRYSAVAIAFHWVIAGAILGQIWLGWTMSDLPNGLRKFELFQLHKSVGITILLLSLGRLAWRLTHRPPPYAAGVRGWQHALASAVHAAFYVMMSALPLTGWATVSARPFNLPTLLYGTVRWPHLPGLAELPAARKPSRDADLSTVQVGAAWLQAGPVASIKALAANTPALTLHLQPAVAAPVPAAPCATACRRGRAAGASAPLPRAALAGAR